MAWKTMTSVLALTTIALAGCLGDDGGSFDFDRGFKETNKTVHLKMTVVDLLDHEVAPELKTNMWAFCAEAFDPNDQYSVDAIEHFTPLPGDAPKLPQGLREKCSVPGPTIRVQQGDRVIVEFSHSHFHPHTIHWHGQFVPWDSDGAPGVSQDSVEAGGTFTYDFIAKRAGTLWYHCHVDTQHHVMQGLYGAFIVEPQDKSHEPEDIDQEYVWVLSGLNKEVVRAIPGVDPHSQHAAGCASGFQGCENPPADVETDTFMVNGHSYPLTMDSPETLLRVAEGDRVRLRLVNVGETFETMHPHGHDMYVTHRDGNPLPPAARFWVDTLTIGPGERYDVVMEMDNPGPWMFHTHVNSHETTCGKSGGGMHSMIVYEGHDMHGFKAELPPTCPYEEPFAISSDHVAVHRLSLGTDAEARQSFGFPVNQECSVRSVTVVADLQADNLLLASLSNLTVAVADPSGTVVAGGVLGTTDAVTRFNVTLSALDLVSFYDGRDMTPDAMLGGWSVTVAGRALEASVLGTVSVDYLETLEQSRRHHLDTGLPACPGIST